MSHEWMDDSACLGVDPEAWFGLSPEEARDRGIAKWADHNRKLTALAIRICQSCPVSRQCYDHAEATREHHGVWGGVRRNAKELERDRQLADMQFIWRRQEAVATETPTAHDAVVVHLRPAGKPADTRHSAARERAAKAWA